MADNFAIWFFWTRRVLPSYSQRSITIMKHALEGCTSHSDPEQIDLCRFRGWVVDNFGKWFFWTKRVLPSCSEGSITPRNYGLEWCTSHSEAGQIDLCMFSGWVADTFGIWFFWTKRVLLSCSDGSIPPGNMLLNDIQVMVRLDKSTFAGSGGEWRTTSQCDFSGWSESYHHVQRAQ